jgi:hypothetical protein
MPGIIEKDNGPFVSGDIPSALFWNKIYVGNVKKLTATVAGSDPQYGLDIALPNGQTIANTIILGARIKFAGGTTWNSLPIVKAASGITMQILTVGGVDKIRLLEWGTEQDLYGASYDILVAELG